MDFEQLMWAYGLPAGLGLAFTLMRFMLYVSISIPARWSAEEKRACLAEHGALALGSVLWPLVVLGMCGMIISKTINFIYTAYTE